MVKFEKISAYKHVNFDLPQRKTEWSAGYDFVVPEDVVIPSLYKTWKNMIKARIASPEFLSAFADSGFIEEINTEGKEKINASPEEQEEFLQGLRKHFPEILEIAEENFVLDLKEMKELTKIAGAKATLIPTGVKAKLKDNQKLELLIRSSTPFHTFLIMGNGVGLIDADYYNNPDNEGHIFFQVINLSPFDIRLNKGDIIGQGVISEYQRVDDDKATGKREGGIGSTTQS